MDEQPRRLAEGGAVRAPANSSLRGFTVQDLTPELRERLGLAPDTPGVVITDMDRASPAAQSGLQPGDVIMSINRQPVRSAEDFERLAADTTGETRLRVNRYGRVGTVYISPGEE